MTPGPMRPDDTPDPVMMGTDCPTCGARMLMHGTGAHVEPCGEHCSHPSRPHHVVHRVYFMGRCPVCLKVGERSFRV